MIESPKDALQRLGREIRRLEEVEDKEGVSQVDFTGWQDSVFNAANIAYHLIDGTFHSNQSISSVDKGKSHVFGQYRLQRERECPELELCGDLANKVKHAVLTRPRTQDGRTDLDLSDTTFIGIEVGPRGLRAQVQQCKIMLNDSPVIPIFVAVFRYWANFLDARDNVQAMDLPKPKQRQLGGSGLPRSGGYYCPRCRTAIGILVPHSDTCATCGTAYQDIPG